MPRFRHAALAILLTCSVASAARPEQYPPRRNVVVAAVEKARDAVVSVTTEQVVSLGRDPFRPFAEDFFHHFFSPYERQYRTQSLGSGCLVDAQGLVLTNEHVIRSASRIKIVLPDEQSYDGEVVGTSPQFDLAVIRIAPEKALPTLSLGSSSDLMIGETVIAIGNPYGLSHTVTTGVVSAVGRSLQVDDERTLRNLIQTDASINPGNSGGPLLNIAGDLIGVNTAIYREAQGIGFAIPIDTARRILDDLIQFGEVKPAFLGINVQDLTPRLAASFGLSSVRGALINRVDAYGPAAGAGLRPGDIIVRIGADSVSSAQEFQSLAAALRPNEEMPLKIIRGEEQLEIKIRAVPLPLDRAEDIIRDWLGVSYMMASTKVAKRYGLSVSQGAVFQTVRGGSRADRAGLQPGDVVVRVNNREVTSKESFEEALLLASMRDEALLIIVRGRLAYHVTL